MDESQVTVSSKTAIVVIGRNEGRRLNGSLHSARVTGLPTVYVDSGSTDGSLRRAHQLSLPIVSLDACRPFSAARARNEGLDEALQRWPELDYVIFLDGDCELNPGFARAASAALEQSPEVAIVVGHLAEKHPEKSPYNLLCSYEWQSSAGRITNFGELGGIMAVNIAAVRSVGCFNTDLIAGEDSELGVRLALAGYYVEKIDFPMAVHDADVLRFAQWWKRSVRAGHSIAHRYALHGQSDLRDCRRELGSTLFWGLVVPLLTLGLTVVIGPVWLLLLGSYLYLSYRVGAHYRRMGLSRGDSTIAAAYMVLSKFANLVGVLRFALNSRSGTFTLIEYKRPS
ncbi:glycosyltransferase family 2 protein [Sphingomonas lutea]|uniref:Glycosyltransferase family 2 protein n=1 Tax=Sphingomonas lutea TaxID=1045317 RepID=A0A7G9SH09_9SPHN|nr:glycosyltransferase family A protein [Sphingomonas lutea]QNN67134.1 glycosyltransferase family 2 protein [Sphingomonas lutea]